MHVDALLPAFYEFCDWVNESPNRASLIPTLRSVIAHLLLHVTDKLTFFNKFHMRYTMLEMKHIAESRVPVQEAVLARLNEFLASRPELGEFIFTQCVEPSSSTHASVPATTTLRELHPTSESAFHTTYKRRSKSPVRAATAFPQGERGDPSIVRWQVPRSDVSVVAATMHVLVAGFGTRGVAPRVWTANPEKASFNAVSAPLGCWKALDLSAHRENVLISTEHGLVTLWGRSEEGEADRAFTERMHYRVCEAPVWSVAFAPRGFLFAAGTVSGGVSLWNVESAQTMYTRGGTGGDDVGALAWHPNVQYLVSSAARGVCTMLDLSDLRIPCRVFSGYTSMLTSVAIDSAGKLLAGASCDGRLLLWDISTGKLIRTWTPPSNGAGLVPLYSVSWSTNGKTLCAAHGSDVLVFNEPDIDLDPRTYSMSVNGVGMLVHTQFLPDSSVILSCIK